MLKLLKCFLETFYVLIIEAICLPLSVLLPSVTAYPGFAD